MSTTNELPPQSLDQKIDTLTQLVIAMRAEISEEARQRYVDLRQRMTEMETRLTAQIDKLEDGQTEMRQNLKLLEKYFHLLDRKVGNLVEETSLWKDRVRELETTQDLGIR